MTTVNFLIFFFIVSTTNISFIKSQPANSWNQNDLSRLCKFKPLFKIGTNSILVYLMRLHLCDIVENSQWLKTECEKRTFAITDYYRAAYSKFCDEENFLRKCSWHEYQSIDNYVAIWTTAMTINITSFKTSTVASVTKNYTLADIEYQYCVEISDFFTEFSRAYNKSSLIYDEKEITNPFYKVKYCEWFLLYRPFCTPVACGAGLKSYNKSPRLADQCFRQTCGQATKISIAIDCLISFSIVVSNLLVLLVAFRTKTMSNVPGYFKISLAVADLMVGLIVLPGSVYQNYRLSFMPLPFRTDGEKPQSEDYFKQSYLNTMGFFTLMSLTASLNFLFTFSIDRYLSVTRPFKAQRGKYLTKKKARYALCFIWCYAFGLGIFPLIKFKYQIVALSLVFADGMIPTIVYSVCLGTPLIFMWILNGSLFYYVRVDWKKSSKSTHNPKHNYKSPVSNNFATKIYSIYENIKPTKPSSNKVGRSDCAPSVDDKKNHLRINNEQIKAIRTPSKLTLKSNKKSLNLQKRQLAEKSITKTLTVMVGAFTMALLPVVTVIFLTFGLENSTDPKGRPDSYSEDHMNAYTTYLFLATRMFLSNSFFNCIIYSVRSKQFSQLLITSLIWNKQRRKRKILEIQSDLDLMTR